MTGRMVQIPEGLVRSAAALLDLAGRANTAGDLLALLSRPTPTVQVPVSLTEQQIRDAIDVAYNERCGQILLPLVDHEFTAIVHVAAEAVMGLLSQPNPTAEHADDCCYLEEDVVEPHGSRINPNAHCTCEPPRIDDMAPGTTFSYLGVRWKMTQGGRLTVEGQPFEHDPFESGPETFDPSTIRDVTPPPIT